MRRPIARIKINAGNPGWYDPLTNIHLTLTRPEGIVYEGANTTNIKKAIAFKLVSVIEGSLETTFTSVELKEKKTQQVREVNPQIKESKKEVIEEIIPVEETTIEVVEEIIPVEEEVSVEVIEEKPKKKAAKKTKAKKETTKKENNK